MDPRTFLPLIPAPFRAVITSLLDRLEALERRQAEQAIRLAELERRQS